MADADLLGLGPWYRLYRCDAGLGVPRRPRRRGPGGGARRARGRPARRRRRARRGARRRASPSGPHPIGRRSSPRSTWRASRWLGGASRRRCSSGISGRELGVVVDAHHPVIEEHPRLAPLVRFSRSTSVVAAPSPLCGADTDEVLEGFGYDEARRAELRDRGGDRMSDAPVDDGWLRNRAAIVGVGHTPYGKRGEHAEKGHLRLVVEAIAAACADAGISPKDVDGYSSYYTSVEPSDLYAVVRREAAQLLRADLGRWRRVDGRRVRERGDGGGHRPGRVRRRAQGDDDGGGRSLRPGLRPDRPVGPDDGGPDGVLGALRAPVAGPDVRPRRPPPHAPVRHDHRALRRGDDQRPAHGRTRTPKPASATSSPWRTTTTAA